MAQVVPELIYRSVIESGITWVKQNIMRVDSMMSGYSATDVASIRNYISDHDIAIVQAWPRTNSPFPCIAIVTLKDTETPFIDEMLGISSTVDGGGLQQGKLWSAENLILICTDNPDLTVALYGLLKLVFQRNNDTLIQYLHELAFDGGDLQPDLNFLPDHIYTRGLSVRASYFVHVQQDFSPIDISSVIFHPIPEDTTPFVEGETDAHQIVVRV